MILEGIIEKFGRGAEIRTPDLLVPKHEPAHYQQLSSGHNGGPALRMSASFQTHARSANDLDSKRAQHFYAGRGHKSGHSFMDQQPASSDTFYECPRFANPCGNDSRL